MKVKVKVSLRSHEGSEGGKECWASVLTLTFGTIRTAELSALRADHTLPLRKYISLYSFLFDAEWTAGLLHADRIGSVEKFQGPCREWNPERPRLVAQFLNQLHRTCRIITGYQCVRRACYVHCEGCLRTSFSGKQTTNCTREIRSVYNLSKRKPASRMSKFCKLCCGTDRARGHLPFPLLFVFDRRRRRNSCES